MSNSQKNGPVVSTSKFSLVKAIVTLFKLGEEGKIESFFERQRKALNRDIASSKTALSVLKQKHENQLEDYADKMEDAHENVINAYMNVEAEKVANNPSAIAYGEIYWERVTVAEANIVSLEESVKEIKEAYELKVKSIEKEIAERTRRLEKISAEA